LGAGLLKPNEIGISATNRNFKGRMGDPSALAYLASPSVVAASAVAGYICGPSDLKSQSSSLSSSSSEAVNQGNIAKTNSTSLPPPVQYQIIRNQPPLSNASHSTEIIDGFPKVWKGELVFCDKDNLDTDGIYPGKYTYKDDLTKEGMAKVVMENYDVDFAKIIKKVYLYFFLISFFSFLFSFFFL